MEISNKISEIKNKKPLISIVVPAFNIEDYIENCLESILSQDYGNIEIILVDDGSTDRTGIIADEYKRKYPTKLKCLHQKNGGVTRARLAGIYATAGEWVGFVDGDDVIESNMYSKLLDNALSYDADISHCGYQTIVNGGERIHYFYNTGHMLEQDNESGLKDLLLGEFVEPGLGNKIYKKTLFQEDMMKVIENRSLRINEDLLMNYLLFKKSERNVYEDFCPYHYLTRSTSATRSEFKPYKVLDPIKVRKYILDDVESELKDVAWKKYLTCCFEAYVALYGKTEWKEKCLELKQELKSNQDKWKLLRKNDLLKLRLCMFSTQLYKLAWGIYEKYFRRKIYE